MNRPETFWLPLVQFFPSVLICVIAITGVGFAIAKRWPSSTAFNCLLVGLLLILGTELTRVLGVLFLNQYLSAVALARANGVLELGASLSFSLGLALVIYAALVDRRAPKE